MTQAPLDRLNETRGRESGSPAGRRSVRVTAASRIHFGLMGFNQSHRPFGGVGMMIDQPSTIVRVESDERLTVRGADRQQLQSLVENWARYHQRDEPADCAIEVVRHAPAHIGLGSGTQTALSVARSLNEFVGVDSNAPEQLAASVGRARRSSVGSWGFHAGGCIVELGHQADQQLASDYRRAAVPDTWRVLLAWPPQRTGLHGSEEESAFAALPQIPAETTARLEHLALDWLLPSLQTADFESFSEHLYEYGLLSGNCFASIQGGPYASARSTKLIEFIRSLGIAGVGQSSWGPLVFAIVRDESHASWLRQRLPACEAANGLRLLLARPHNQGALLELADP